jgi:hypothetical protein
MTPEANSPLCFMHIPKSAGMSFHAALEASLAPGSLSPRRMDSSVFCDFHEFELLRPATRDLVAADDKEIRSMRRFPVVSGHFSLTALLQIATHSGIGTILREPRARVISLYLYWRIPKIWDSLLPYSVEEHALKPLDRFLAEPRLAPAVDNQVCRMLLHGDPRIPCGDFIAKADIDTVAADAIAHLDMLGYTGVLELGDSAWRGLGRLFGVRLEPGKTNVTGEVGNPVMALPGEKILTSRALELIERRSAADRILYDHALGIMGVEYDERIRLSRVAFEDQIARVRYLLDG